MKKILILVLLSLHLGGFTQIIEPQSPGETDMLEGVDMPVEDGKPSQQYYMKDGKYGFISPDNTYQEAKYDKIVSSSNGSIVQIGNLFGLVNWNGQPLTKLEYEKIDAFHGGFKVRKKGKTGFLSKDGELLLSMKYKDVIGRNDYITVVQNEEEEIQLVLNKTEKVFPQKVEVKLLYKNLVIVKSKGKFGVVTDEVIVPFEFDSIAHTISRGTKPNNYGRKGTNNLNFITSGPLLNDFVVLRDDKLGLMDNMGMIIYPTECDEITREEKGYYTIRKENAFSIYFPLSKIKTSFDFSRVYADGYGFVMAVKNKKAGAFSVKGKEIVPFEYDDEFIRQISGCGLLVSKNKKKGIVDSEGNMVVPVVYDAISSFYDYDFGEFIRIRSGNKEGVLNRKGEIILPPDFVEIIPYADYFMVRTPEQESKYGFYDRNGKMILPVEYDRIFKSHTRGSKISIVMKDRKSYNFLNQKNELILPENCSEFGFIPDQNQWVTPYHHLMHVKSKEGKWGMINQFSGMMDIPLIYDEILQYFIHESHTYFAVKKGKFVGLINENNETIIPLEYSDISLDFVKASGKEEVLIVVAKGKKYGAVNLKGDVRIPFEYTELKRIAEIPIYKAKKEKQFQIVDGNNTPISKDLFDEVANFEMKDVPHIGEEPIYVALTFNMGKMRVIDSGGNYIKSEKPMKPHVGYTSFEALKSALIEALESEDDVLLQEFAVKIAPSEHLLVFIKRNIFTNSPLDDVNITDIQEKYFSDLLNFKRWYWQENVGFNYDRSALTLVQDYVTSRDGIVTNTRYEEQAFGDTRILENILRDAFQVNGYWISSYFMKRSFQTY